MHESKKKHIINCSSKFLYEINPNPNFMNGSYSQSFLKASLWEPTFFSFKDNGISNFSDSLFWSLRVLLNFSSSDSSTSGLLHTKEISLNSLEKQAQNTPT